MVIFNNNKNQWIISYLNFFLIYFSLNIFFFFKIHFKDF